MSHKKVTNFIRRIVVLSVAFVALPETASVSAQATPTRDKEVARTSFSDKYVSKKYRDAVKIYEETIEKYYPGLINNDAELRYQYCDCLWNLAKTGSKSLLKKAEEKLLAFVNENDQYVAGRFLYASVLAKQKKEEAKEQLITAAQLGVPVLRQIQDTKARHFQYLLKEPKFILEVVKATSTGNVAIQRNFFLLPYNPNPEKPADPIENTQIANNAKKKTEIEEKILKLFSDIRAAVDNSEYEGLLDKFRALNGLIRAYDKSGVDEAVKKQLAQFKKDYKAKRYIRIRLFLELQDYNSRGQRSLREMEQNLKRKKFEEVFQGFQKVSAIVDKMRSVDRPEYQQRADKLFFYAKTINDKAVKQKQIDELKLKITGIVLAPSQTNSEGETGNSALINDHIYREGQPIVDVHGNYVSGLTVHRIVEGAVRFRYEDTTFVRLLEANKDSKAR